MGSQPRSSVVAQILRLFPVQLRGEAAGSEGELDEAAAGRHHDEDGGARAGVNAEQAAGTRMYVEYSDNKSNKVTVHGFAVPKTSSCQLLLPLIQGGGPAQLV